jgi:hypothetical protein
MFSDWILLFSLHSKIYWKESRDVSTARDRARMCSFCVGFDQSMHRNLSLSSKKTRIFALLQTHRTAGEFPNCHLGSR